MRTLPYENYVNTNGNCAANCSCTKPVVNGFIEDLLGAGGQPLTTIGFEIKPQSAILIGLTVVGAGLLIKYI